MYNKFQHDLQLKNTAKKLSLSPDPNHGEESGEDYTQKYKN